MPDQTWDWFRGSFALLFCLTIIGLGIYTPEALDQSKQSQPATTKSKAATKPLPAQITTHTLWYEKITPTCFDGVKAPPRPLTEEMKKFLIVQPGDTAMITENDIITVERPAQTTSKSSDRQKERKLFHYDMIKLKLGENQICIDLNDYIQFENKIPDCTLILVRESETPHFPSWMKVHNQITLEKSNGKFQAFFTTGTPPKGSLFERR